MFLVNEILGLSDIRKNVCPRTQNRWNFFYSYGSRSILCETSWIRFLVEAMIRIRIATNADPHHWKNVQKQILFFMRSVLHLNVAGGLP